MALLGELAEYAADPHPNPNPHLHPHSHPDQDEPSQTTCGANTRLSYAAHSLTHSLSHTRDTQTLTPSRGPNSLAALSLSHTTPNTHEGRGQRTALLLPHTLQTHSDRRAAACALAPTVANVPSMCVRVCCSAALSLSSHCDVCDVVCCMIVRLRLLQ
jgi:hypothetical protein